MTNLAILTKCENGLCKQASRDLDLLPGDVLTWHCLGYKITVEKKEKKDAN